MGNYNGFTDWVFDSPDARKAFCYHAAGYIKHGNIIQESSGKILPRLVPGSELTVTLREGWITFTTGGKTSARSQKTVSSFELPKNFGRVSLAVSIRNNG